MNVCLVRPPSFVNPNSYIAALTPPIGVAYLAAAVRNAGHRVTIIDALGESPLSIQMVKNGIACRGLSAKEIIDKIPVDTDVIGFSCMFSSEWVQLRKLFNEIANAFPNVLCVGGGEHFTAMPEYSMSQCPRIDACVLGEGEHTFVDLLSAYAEKRSLSSVNGLVFRHENSYIRTEERGRIRSIDSISEPAWDLLPIQNYLQHELGWGVNRGRSIPLLATRGCPYECTFCSNPLMWKKKWIARDPIAVVDEMSKMVVAYGIQNFDLYDLTAILKKTWIVEFCNELIKRNLNICWQLPSGTRSEVVNSEIAGLLYRSGCKNITFAPESGSESSLLDMKKKLDLDKLLLSVRSSVKSGLNVKINIILGLPGESDLDIWKTFWLLVKLSFYGAHDVSPGIFAPYPGSKLHDELLRAGKIELCDQYFDDLAYVDISKTVSYCEKISSRRLIVYNWLGFLVFYLSNYAFRPARLLKTLINILFGRQESRGEMAIIEFVKRRQNLWKRGRLAN